MRGQAFHYSQWSRRPLLEPWRRRGVLWSAIVGTARGCVEKNTGGCHRETLFRVRVVLLGVELGVFCCLFGGEGLPGEYPPVPITPVSNLTWHSKSGCDSGDRRQGATGLNCFTEPRGFFGVLSGRTMSDISNEQLLQTAISVWYLSSLESKSRTSR